MNSILKIAIGLLIVALGAGIVIFCDSKGFFNGENKNSVQNCDHEISRSKCFICNPELIAKSETCSLHHKSLAICTICDPAIIPAFKILNDWCGAHNTPESQCEKCNPQLANKSKASPKFNLTVTNDTLKIAPNEKWLRETNKSSSECEVESSIIQFTSPLTAQKAGLEYQSVVEKPFSKSISCPVSIQYNANRYVQITARTTGFMMEVKKDLGETVKAGEILAYIKSNELTVAKAEFLQANGQIKLNKNNYNREKKLVENLASTEFNLVDAQAKLIESEIAYSLSEQKLINLDLNKDQIRKIQDGDSKFDLLPLTTPIAGIILERQIQNGASIEIGTKLFSISDISNMWAILDIYEKDIFDVEVGQKVFVVIDNLEGKYWEGVITWISTQIDTSLRTLKARVELSNQNSLLKAGMLGKAKIKIADEKPALIVNKSSVQWDGCCHVVFVKINDFVIEPRKIKITSETQDSFVVTGNIKKGELLVTTGSFLMKTEIAKGSIGAGCCPE